MNKLQDVPTAADKKDWFTRRPFPIFIIAAWSIFPLFILPWASLFHIFNSGQLSILQFILILLHPLLPLVAGISLLRLRSYSVYLFIASLVIGIINIRLLSVGRFNLIIAFGIIIYCLWLRRTRILK